MNEILTTILERHKTRMPEITRFTDTGYSFEEWLNWESFDACQQKGWKLFPKPQYKACGFKKSINQADLLVEPLQSKKVIIEFGLIHDFSQSRWRDKLEADRKKLEPPFADFFEPIQVVYVTSKRDFRQQDNWTRWLEKISFWNQPTVFSEALEFSNGGVFQMSAWRIENK
jgi:hypothetical protein